MGIHVVSTMFNFLRNRLTVCHRTALFCISTSSVWGFQALHILTNTCHCLSLTMANLAEGLFIGLTDVSLWRTGNPGVLQYMGWQSVKQDLATEQWTTVEAKETQSARTKRALKLQNSDSFKLSSQNQQNAKFNQPIMPWLASSTWRN